MKRAYYLMNLLMFLAFLASTAAVFLFRDPGAVVGYLIFCAAAAAYLVQMRDANDDFKALKLEVEKLRSDRDYLDGRIRLVNEAIDRLYKSAGESADNAKAAIELAKEAKGIATIGKLR